MHKASRSKSKLYRLSLLGAIFTSILIFYPHEPVALPAEGVTPTTIQATVTTTTLVPQHIIQMWEKVAWCETHGNWHFVGSRYDGGLGIMPVNWHKYAPENFPAEAHLATPEQQVYVARQIQAAGGYPNYVPDQNGECHGW